MKDADAGANHALRRGRRTAEAAFRKERQSHMATKPKSKATAVVLAEQLIAGTNKHLTNTTQVLFAGSSFTPAQVTAQLQALVNLRHDVDNAKASTKAKLAAEKTDMPALRTFMSAFVTFVKAAYGNAPDVLADFGLHPPKPRTPPTIEAKAAAAAKRKATRAARHTMGSKQKKVVKGAVTGIVLTAITAPQPVATVPNSPSAPAPSAGTTATPAPHTT
jgi:hypothetical protein